MGLLEWMLITSVTYWTFYLFYAGYLTKRTTIPFIPWIGMLAFLVVYKLIPVSENAYFTAVVMLVIVFLVALFCFKGEALKMMALACIGLMVTTAGDILPLVVVSVLHGISIRELFGDMRLLRICAYCSYLFSLLVVLLIRRLFKRERFIESGAGHLMVSAYAMILTVASLNAFDLITDARMSLADPHLLLYLLFAPIMLFSFLFIFIYYDNAYKRKELEITLQLNRERDQHREALIWQYEKSMDDKNNLIHDYKNSVLHLTAVIGKPDVAKAYCEELVAGYSRQLEPYRFEMNNEILGVILGKLQYDCGQTGVRLDLQISHCDFSFLSPMDTSSLFGNLFDNALAACRALDGGRFINVAISKTNDLVYIAVSNSHDDHVRMKKGAYLSARRNYDEKGRGIDIIRSIAIKYQGDMGIVFDNHEFSAVIWLKQKK